MDQGRTEAEGNNVLPIQIRPKATDGFDLEIPPGEGRVVVRIEEYPLTDLPRVLAAGGLILIPLAGRALVVRVTRYRSAAPALGVAT